MPACKTSQRVIETGDLCRARNLATGKAYRIQIRRPRAFVSLRLFDHFGAKPLAGVSYALTGAQGARFEGETGADGSLVHEVVRQDLRLKVTSPGGREYELAVPWQDTAEPAHLQPVPGYGAYEVWVEVRALSGKTVAGEAYLLTGPDTKRLGTTDEAGRLRVDLVPFGEYELAIASCTIKLPAIERSSREPHIIGVRSAKWA